MAIDCIILAGGLGTRLRSVVSEVPKVLAPVNEKPFLHYLLVNLQQQGITNIILATGYKHELIESFIDNRYPGLTVQHSVENEPLGTGGAIHKAMLLAKSDNVLILNGDSFIDVDYTALGQAHCAHQADCSMVLKHMHNFDRYGCVETNDDLRINAFLEKQYREEGAINAGVYLINREKFLSLPFPEKFSMEKDYMEAMLRDIGMYGFFSEGYFIDIGIPEDYERVQTDFKQRFA